METGIVEHNNFTMGDIQTMADALAESKVNGYNKAQLLSLLLISQAEGIHPMLGIQRYDIIPDKKTGGCKIEKKAYAMLGEFKDKGGDIEWIERTDKIAKARFTEPNGRASIFEYTEQDAKTAGLIDAKGNAPDWSNWKKRRGVMLTTKVIKLALRLIDPSSGLGDHDTSEVEYSEPVNVTPTDHKSELDKMRDIAKDFKPTADGVGIEYNAGNDKSNEDKVEMATKEFLNGHDPKPKSEAFKVDYDAGQVINEPSVAYKNLAAFVRRLPADKRTMAMEDAEAVAKDSDALRDGEVDVSMLSPELLVGLLAELKKRYGGE